MGKNLQRVKDMLDGNYKHKIQSGYTPTEEKREIGDIWTDSDDITWEQKDGFRSQVSKMANVGIFKGHCKDCETGIVKPWDKDTYKADGRCYHCQLNYELDLQFDAPIRWFAYRRLKDFRNMESIQKDMEQWVDAITEERKEKVFDKTIANALANENIEMTINKNKNMTK